MKKLISGLTLAALMGTMSSQARDMVVETEQGPVTIQITADEEAACRRILDRLQERYTEINLHEEIVAALQKVADENRADFDTAKHILGVQLEDGSWVFPIDTRFVVR